MPIDINLLRADKGGDPEAVREVQRRRFKAEGAVDEVLELDARWREQITLRDQLRQQLNTLQREVIAPRKKRKEPCEEEVAEAERLRERLRQLEAETLECERERYAKLCVLGNALDASVPISQSEDDNEVVSLWPAGAASEGCARPDTDEPLTHDELLWRIGGYEPERGQRVAGDRAYFLRDAGVLLTQALQSYAAAFLRERGYSLMQPPYFMKRELMASVAQLADFDEQLYKVGGRTGGPDDPGEKYLIATSEQPLCAFHCKEVLDESELPLRYAGISTCFRREVGKMSEDIRGIFRVHQFEKVEQFCVTAGDVGESKRMHQEMLHCVEDFHRSLGLAYRVVNVVSGELNDAAMIKYDLEGWFPGQGAYRELVSCSNCTDFQSRALDVRYRPRSAGQAAPSSGAAPVAHVHMLNSTLTATGRGMCCILEAYQTREGVRVPEVLIPYMGGTAFLPFLHPPREATGGASASSSAPARPARAARPPTAAPAMTAAPAAAASRAAPDAPAALPASAPAAAVVGGAEPPGEERVVVGGRVRMAALEERLSVFSYVDGFVPSREDAAVFGLLGDAAQVDAATFPSVARWRLHVASFAARERAAWA